MRNLILSILLLSSALASAALPPDSLACARRVFSQPGVRFMQKLCTQRGEAALSVANLPKGLKWNARRKLVEGIVKKGEGNYQYTVVLKQRDGSVTTETISLEVSSSLIQPVPFMGWLSWNVYEADINEEKFLAQAHALKRYGLDTLGYRYVCLDDWWHSGSEHPDGPPTCDAKKFLHGMKWLADTIHALGLKIGIYSDAAEKTCAGAFGSYGYEVADARQYAEWGMDLLKYDYCGAPAEEEEARKRYAAMGNALKDCGRPILFYACEWGVREPWRWASETGATCWRCTYDTRDFWDWGKKYDSGHLGIIQDIDIMKHLWPYAGVNRFNDADMMMVGLHGNGKSSSHDAASYPTGQAGLTAEESRSHFSLWAMFASPLTLCFDLTHISDEDLSIISNSEMIAINQDRMGQQACLLADTEVKGKLSGKPCRVEVYAKDLENGDMAVAVFNRGDEPVSYKLLPAELGLCKRRKYVFHDVWGVDKEDRIVRREGSAFNVDSHQTRVFRIK